MPGFGLIWLRECPGVARGPLDTTRVLKQCFRDVSGTVPAIRFRLIRPSGANARNSAKIIGTAVFYGQTTKDWPQNQRPLVFRAFQHPARACAVSSKPDHGQFLVKTPACAVPVTAPAVLFRCSTIRHAMGTWMRGGGVGSGSATRLERCPAPDFLAPTALSRTGERTRKRTRILRGSQGRSGFMAANGGSWPAVPALAPNGPRSSTGVPPGAFRNRTLP